MNHVGPTSTINSKRWRRMRENVGSDSMVWIMGIFAVQTTDMMMSPLFVMAHPLGEEEEITGDQLGGFWFKNRRRFFRGY